MGWHASPVDTMKYSKWVQGKQMCSFWNIKTRSVPGCSQTHECLIMLDYSNSITVQPMFLFDCVWSLYIFVS